MKEDQLWDASLDDLKRGFQIREDKIECLICGQTYEKGVIYQNGNQLLEAEKQMQLHLKQAHGSVLDALLKLNPEILGMSESQKEIAALMASGLSDQEIARQKGVTLSTIRNYRFKLREKQKQARLFLTVMELLEKRSMKKVRQCDDSVLVDAHRTATMRDERYALSEKERAVILKTYFDDQGALKEMPAKEKRKLAVYAEIAGNFKPDRKYTEKQINTILKRIWSDYVYLRRALIEYGFLERTQTGSEYWRKI